jgi:hypothetical protein
MVPYVKKMCPKKVMEVKVVLEDRRYGPLQTPVGCSTGQLRKHKLRGYCTVRCIATFDDLVIVPAQVSRPSNRHYNRGEVR